MYLALCDISDDIDFVCHSELSPVEEKEKEDPGSSMPSPKQALFKSVKSGGATGQSTPMTSHAGERKESKSEPKKQLTLPSKHGFHKSASASSLTLLIPPVGKCSCLSV